MEKVTEYSIDFKKVKTVEDVNAILKGLVLSVKINKDEVPEHLKELVERNLLIKKGKD